LDKTGLQSAAKCIERVFSISRAMPGALETYHYLPESLLQLYNGF